MKVGPSLRRRAGRPASQPASVNRLQTCQTDGRKRRCECARCYSSSRSPCPRCERSRTLLPARRSLVAGRRAGACHSDVAIYREFSEYFGPPHFRPSYVLGHESSGSAEELGPGVEGIEIGSAHLVSAHLVSGPIGCGHCPACSRGQNTSLPLMTPTSSPRRPSRTPASAGITPSSCHCAWSRTAGTRHSSSGSDTSVSWRSRCCEH